MDLLTVPAPPPRRAGSLLAAAATPTEQLARFAGYGYRAPGAGSWELSDPCAPDTVGPSHAGAGPSLVQGQPFLITASDECSTFGLTVEQLPTLARDMLALVAGPAVARELWTGELRTAAVALNASSPWAANRAFVSPSTVDLTPVAGTPVGIDDGFGLLEQALADRYPGQHGYVHGAPIVTPHLPGTRREGDLILTQRDTRVVLDDGYPGTGPTGAAPPAGSTWLYGTARPAVWFSAPNVASDMAGAIDRARNSAQYVADQLAVVAFPHVAVAVLVTTNTP